MHWTLLIDDPRPGWENMALDAALLDLAAGEGVGFLRLYRWAPHCLSFGRHEPAARRYDRARISALGLDCVRRPTGGRAVWHARELTYAVAAPLAAFGGMQQAYRQIHGILAEAIRALGAAPELALKGAVRPLTPASGPCFNAPVGGEVVVDHRKVVGSAQLKQGKAFLQHGSLLLEDDQSLPRSLASLPPNDSAEAPLARLLGRPLEFDEAAAAVTRAAEAELGPFQHAGWPAEVATVAQRHADRFQDVAWTWQR